MRYSMNFGRLAASPPRARHIGDAFRIAVLGDFSARANKGMIETGDELASRHPVSVDVDTFEAVFRRWNATLRLPIADGATLDIKIESLDDFHPDQLYNNLELLSELSALRRRLKNTSTFAAAAQQMQSWTGISRPRAASQAPARGTEIPPGTLSDFARLIGQLAPTAVAASPAEELIRHVVAPYIVAAPHPDQDAMIAAVDDALSAAMRQILHHAHFQALESLWRSVDLLVRELETDGQLQIVLYDVTAEEIAADLSSTDILESSGLYRLLVEQPMNDQRLGPLAVLIGNYLFDLTPPHAELLGRIGKLAATAQAPFIAGISADCVIDRDPNEEHPLITESWNALQQTQQAAYLGLTVPRFMLRWPYGAATEPIESFRFEEFTPRAGLRGMLWADGAFLAGLLLGKTFSEQGLSNMQLGSIMAQGDVPFYYYTDPDGDQIALPNTERLISETTAAYIISQNFMPVLCIRGRPEVRLGSFASLNGALLAGPWAPLEIEPDEGVSLMATTGPTLPLNSEALSVAEHEAREAAEAARELDSLLADGSDAPVSSDAELDSALASLTKNSEVESAAAEGGMDPDLAALLDKL